MKRNYRVLVAERLDPAWSGWLHNATIMHNDNGSTTLLDLADDAQTLLGVLSKLDELGATLISVEAVTVTPTQAIVTMDEICTRHEKEQNND